MDECQNRWAKSQAKTKYHAVSKGSFPKYLIITKRKIVTLQWTDDHCIYYSGQESLRRNVVANMVNKRARNAIFGSSLKKDRMISVCFQGKPFNITVIQGYAPTSNAEEAEVEWLYEDLQDLQN